MGPESLETVVDAHITQELLLLALSLFVLAVFKNLMEMIVMGLIWRWRSPYEEDEIVCVDGEWGRIVYMGYIKTKFVIYLWDTDKRQFITGGKSMWIANSELSKRKIQALLPLVDIPQVLRKAIS